MKREIFIVIGISIIIIIVHIILQNYTHNFFENICEDLGNVQSKIFSSDFQEDELKKDIADLQSKWENNQNYFAYFIEHDELEKVTVQLTSIESNIKVGDFNKSVDEIERCKTILRHIEEKDSFMLVNIF